MLLYVFIRFKEVPRVSAKNRSECHPNSSIEYIKQLTQNVMKHKVKSLDINGKLTSPKTYYFALRRELKIC